MDEILSAGDQITVEVVRSTSAHSGLILLLFILLCVVGATYVMLRFLVRRKHEKAGVA